MVSIILRKDFQNLLTRSVFSGIIYSLRNHSVKMCLLAKLHFYTMKPEKSTSKEVLFLTKFALQASEIFLRNVKYAFGV